MPTSTPWGASQDARSVTRGIMFYSTASHGGYHVSPTLNNKMHPALRNRNGWYEEDCEWAFVALAFPKHFDLDIVVQAHSIAKNYFPDRYEKWYREVNFKPFYSIPLEESRVKRERAFLETNHNNYIVVSAQTDSMNSNFVVCWAVKGSRTFGGSPRKEEAKFLVPSEEYGQRGEFGFVIDVSKHKRI